MNRLTRFLLTALSVGAAQMASAFDYHDGDLLLVFRGGTGANDVEFNLGSVTNYLALASGTQVTVTNWDLATLQASFNDELNGVSFALFTATSLSDSWLRIWATSSRLAGAPSEMAISPWLNLRGQVSEVGLAATSLTLTNPSPTFVIAAGSAGAYDFIAANGNLNNNVATFNGLLPFSAETTIPGKLAFYQLEPSNGSPKPPATLVGSFNMDASGNLTFRAGPMVVLSAAHISSITRSGTKVTVFFTTSGGATYRLRYAAEMNGPWATLPAAVVGDGATNSLTDDSTDSMRFYQVVTSAN